MKILIIFKTVKYLLIQQHYTLDNNHRTEVCEIILAIKSVEENIEDCKEMKIWYEIKIWYQIMYLI